MRTSTGLVSSGLLDPFDFIIIGAGSAGCVPANPLSENGDNRVLLLEAGGRNDTLRVRMPAGVVTHLAAFNDPSQRVSLGRNENYSNQSPDGETYE